VFIVIEYMCCALEEFGCSCIIVINATLFMGIFIKLIFVRLEFMNRN
jgi:hypothetical protein